MSEIYTVKYRIYHAECEGCKNLVEREIGSRIYTFCKLGIDVLDRAKSCQYKI